MTWLIGMLALLALAPAGAFAASGAQISGTVTDAQTHAGIEDIQVQVLDANGGTVGVTTTAPGGTYTVSGLSAGSYKVEFSPDLGGNYIAQYYSGESSLASADSVSVTSGGRRSGIDAALQAGGQLSGTVIDARTRAGIANIEVLAIDASGNSVGSATTGPDGTYTVSALPSGSYQVEFFPDSDGGNYVTQYYSGKSSVASADSVSVTAGATTSAIDAALQAGGQISGTVTDARTHAGIASIQVQVFDASDNFVGSATTAPDGTYTVSGLSSGSYRVGFSAGFDGGNYVTQYYSGKSSLSSASSVPVTAGATRSGINVALQAGGQISGTVTDAQTHAGIADVQVQVDDSGGSTAGFATTAADGTYTVSGLSSGSYTVGFSPGFDGGNYVAQYYSGESSLSSADSVSVTAGATTSAIDAALQAGGQISGTVTDAQTHAGIANIDVQVYDTTGSPAGFTTTAADGTYTVSGLSAGSDKVEFFPAGSGNYITQYYDGASSLAGADAISVGAGATTSGIDAALQPGGQISGTVTDAHTHAGIANVDVEVDDSTGSAVGFATTAADGTYTVSGLPAGSYTVDFSLGFGGNYIAQFYDGASSPTTADSVAVTAGAMRSGIDAALQAGGQISGTVTDAQTHAGIGNIEVQLYDATGSLAGSATTAADGTYTVSGLSTGTYWVGFSAGYSGGNYAPQYYSGQSSLASAASVAVTAGAMRSGIDAVLQAGGQISGTVTDAQTHAGIEDIEVQLYDSTGSPAGSATTAPDGTYTVSGLSTGSYRVEFSAASHIAQFYDGASSLASADAISVTSGSTTSGINAVLQPATEPLTISLAGTGSGTVSGSGISCPGTCSERYASGTSVTLTATPASVSTFTGWSGDGCSGTAACTVTMSSDQSVTATFTATAVPPVAPPSAPPAAPLSVPPVATPSNGSRPTIPGDATISALPSAGLVPHGRAAKIATILKTGGYTITFRASTAGKTETRWYFAPARTRHKKGKSRQPVLVAAGALTVSKVGPAKLKIKLTGAGKRLLAHAGSIELTAKTTFAPTGRPAVSSTKTFALRR